MDAEEARHAAMRSFGGVAQVKEHQREARMFRWLAGGRQLVGAALPQANAPLDERVAAVTLRG